MNRLLEWLIGSSWFKKYSAMFGGIALGMWVQATYWKQIKATLDIWGIPHDAWMKFLWAVIGAAGIAMSIGLTLVKGKQVAKKSASADQSSK